MPIHGPLSIHQEETITPQGVHCPKACLLETGVLPPQGTPKSPSQQNVALACLFATPARVEPQGEHTQRTRLTATGGRGSGANGWLSLSLSLVPALSLCVRVDGGMYVGLPGQRQLWLFGEFTTWLTIG
jgi:hypothetical protein